MATDAADHDAMLPPVLPEIVTDRLRLRPYRPADDAAFFVRLTHDPAWLAAIGPRGLDTPAAAEAYLRDSQLGRFGYVITLKPNGDAGDGAEGERVGICGFLKRDFLDAIDVGYAVLSDFHRRGICTEAVAALLGAVPAGTRVLAFMSPSAVASAGVVRKLGFAAVAGRDLASGPVDVYEWTAPLT